MPRLQLHAIPMDDSDAAYEQWHGWRRIAASRRHHDGGARDEHRPARAWEHDEDQRVQRRELKLRSLHHGRR